jgi:hypothetical protein
MWALKSDIIGYLFDELGEVKWGSLRFVITIHCHQDNVGDWDAVQAELVKNEE